MKRNGLYSAVRGFAAAVLALGCLAPVAVAQKTTTSQANGNWNAIAWDNGAPAAGDTVYINHTVTNTASTPDLAGLNVNAAKTLVCTGWDTVVSAAMVNVDGTITHADNWSATTNAFGEWIPIHRIHIVCSNLTVAATTGKILADTLGFRGATNGTANLASGPGAPTDVAGATGGGYGSFGGNAERMGGPHYGDPRAPVMPGSGGGGRNGHGRGGPGGGVILIEANGLVTVNGTISANGGNGSVGFSGGGSGGSVWIKCRQIAGGGTISAIGGVQNGGAHICNSGAGGRIAIEYDTAAQQSLPQPTLSFSAAPGTPSTYFAKPDIGTVSLPDSGLLRQPINVTGQLLGLGASWSPASLDIDNRWVRFPEDGFELNVSGTVTVQGASGRLDLGGAGVYLLSPIFLPLTTAADAPFCAPFLFNTNTGPRLVVGGDLVITNSASLHVYSGPTNNVFPEYGGLVTVAGGMAVEAGSWVYPYSHFTNGGSARFDVDRLTIAAGGGFNADGKGYSGGMHAQVGSYDGFGPGKGPGGVSTASGGGYGGLGGAGSGLANGLTYGSSNAPAACGSGGGGRSTARLGGNGGGLVWIRAAQSITHNGAITANGIKERTTSTPWCGGGSGGGIFLYARTFSGTDAGAVLRANGGAGASVGGGGGGGRIAVWYGDPYSLATPASLRTISATPPATYAGTTYTALGATTGTPVGQNGTIVWGQTFPPSGTLITIR